MSGAHIAETTEFRRELLVALGPASNLERSGDALIVRDVNLLAAGTWTDSGTRTPCEYAPAVLEQYAANWADSSLWSRHLGGAPRRITEKVGTVLNPHFENDAVVGDLALHGLTSESRDTIALIEAGEANYVSVEHTGRERWNVGRKVHEAQEILFLGAAVVNRGACARCTLRANEDGDIPEHEPEPDAPAADTASEPDDGQGTRPETVEVVDMTETPEPEKDFSGQIAALEAAVAPLDLGQLEKAAALEAATTELAEIKRQLEEAQQKIAAFDEIDARLKKLEAVPERKTRIDPGAERELSIVTDGVLVDRASGTVMGV
ncbi:MAG TPA: hypothetical protein PLY91_09405 [Methanoregulaceae archaeon]|nr:hypothetical protein [Methanoregulaceae archaeon]